MRIDPHCCNLYSKPPYVRACYKSYHACDEGDEYRRYAWFRNSLWYRIGLFL